MTRYRSVRTRLVQLGALLLLGLGPVARAGAPITVIDGFRLDLSQLTEEDRAALLPGYAHQIAIITSAGLPDGAMALMRTIPIVVRRDRPTEGSIASFTRQSADGRGTVVADARPLPPQKPLLLHEMLHAWDWNTYRFRNKTIEEAYAAAKSGRFHGYPNSHFLANAREFFAVAGTIYLTGHIEQPPFDCATLSVHQPDFLAFLGRTFGVHDPCGPTNH